MSVLVVEQSQEITVAEQNQNITVSESTNTIEVKLVGTQGAAGPSDHTLLSNIGTNTHAQIDSHIANTSNPHSVTKTQVGLSNVVNADTTTTANITDSLDKRFVTDADLTKLSNTSGTNTGDQNLSGLVPYSGATTNLDMGSFGVTSNNFKTTDTTTFSVTTGSNTVRLADRAYLQKAADGSTRLYLGKLYTPLTTELFRRSTLGIDSLGNVSLMSETASIRIQPSTNTLGTSNPVFAAYSSTIEMRASCNMFGFLSNGDAMFNYYPAIFGSIYTALFKIYDLSTDILDKVNGVNSISPQGPDPITWEHVGMVKMVEDVETGRILWAPLYRNINDASSS